MNSPQALPDTVPARLLIVEDDRDVRSLVSERLRALGHVVDEAVTVQEAWSKYSARAPDLVLLDLLLRGGDGLDLLRLIRAQANGPVLILSSRGTETDRVIGLELGADDYLAKPFGMRELEARVKALLRRHRAHGAVPDKVAPRVQFGRCTVDTAMRTVRTPHGVHCALSGREYRLLLVFLQSPGRVLSREELMHKVYRRDHAPADRSIDILVSKLRGKLLIDPRDGAPIRTLHGEGYLYAGPSEEQA